MLVSTLTFVVLSNKVPSESSDSYWFALLQEKGFVATSAPGMKGFEQQFVLEEPRIRVYVSLDRPVKDSPREYLERERRSTASLGLPAIVHEPSFGNEALVDRSSGTYSVKVADGDLCTEIKAMIPYARNEQGVAEPKHRPDWYVQFFDAVTRYVVSETKAEKLTSNGNDLVGGDVRYKNLVDWVNTTGYTYVFDRDNATVLIEKDDSKVLFYAASHHAKVGNEHIKMAATVPTRNGVFFVPESFLQTLH